ncbi:hypothetical protein B0H11DRAFT_1926040 [Mycena galericulata]|nr:hypothetical protein B0H11DRAFT_1926040 [Mycena galericulata]
MTTLQTPDRVPDALPAVIRVVGSDDVLIAPTASRGGPTIFPTTGRVFSTIQTRRGRARRARARAQYACSYSSAAPLISVRGESPRLGIESRRRREQEQRQEMRARADANPSPCAASTVCDPSDEHPLCAAPPHPHQPRIACAPEAPAPPVSHRTRLPCPHQPPPYPAPVLPLIPERLRPRRLTLSPCQSAHRRQRPLALMRGRRRDADVIPRPVRAHRQGGGMGWRMRRHMGGGVGGRAGKEVEAGRGAGQSSCARMRVMGCTEAASNTEALAVDIVNARAPYVRAKIRVMRDRWMARRTTLDLRSCGVDAYDASKRGHLRQLATCGWWLISLAAAEIMPLLGLLRWSDTLALEEAGKDWRKTHQSGISWNKRTRGAPF